MTRLGWDVMVVTQPLTVGLTYFLLQMTPRDHLHCLGIEQE